MVGRPHTPFACSGPSSSPAARFSFLQAPAAPFSTTRPPTSLPARQQRGWPIDAAPDGRREEEGVRGVWDGVAEECVVVAGPATRGALGRMRIGSGEGSEEGGARSCRGRWSGVRGAELADNVGLVDVGQSIRLIDPSRIVRVILAQGPC